MPLLVALAGLDLHLAPARVASITRDAAAQTAPPCLTTMCPISPADARPFHGLPSSTSPPPTPVPQKTPSSDCGVAPGAEIELGLRSHVDIIADLRGHAELLRERGRERERRLPVGEVLGLGDGARLPVDLPGRPDPDAGEIAGGRQRGARERLLQRGRQRIDDGRRAPLVGVGRSGLAEHAFAARVEHDRLDLRARRDQVLRERAMRG